MKVFYSLISKNLYLYKQNFTEYNLILKLQKKSIEENDFEKFQYYTQLEQFTIEKIETYQKSSVTLLKDAKKHLGEDEQADISKFLYEIENLKNEALIKIKENLDFLKLKKSDFTKQIDNFKRNVLTKSYKSNFNKINSRILCIYS